jgi:hypothetical protein
LGVDVALSPICLDEILERGAVYKGRPVDRIQFCFSGGELKLELESPDMALPSLTPKQQAILQVVDEMAIGDVLSYDEIATLAGYSNSSDLREYVQRLFEAGRLSRDRRGWRRVK